MRFLKKLLDKLLNWGEVREIEKRIAEIDVERLSLMGAISPSSSVQSGGGQAQQAQHAMAARRDLESKRRADQLDRERKDLIARLSELGCGQKEV